MRISLILAALAPALASTAALAHHGWSTYDATRTVTITAPIVSASYQNPHGALQVDHDGGRWTIVLAPPSRLSARGVAAADLAAGKTVRIEGYVSRVQERELRAERIGLGGRVVELR